MCGSLTTAPKSLEGSLGSPTFRAFTRSTKASRKRS